MNYLDVIIIAVTLLCLCLGLISGVIWQVAGIVSLVCGVVATFLFADRAAGAMERWVSHPGLAHLMAYVGVFSVASLGVRILATVFAKLLHKAKLKTIDRVLGGAIGVVKAIAICAVIIVIMDRQGTAGSRQAVEGSLLATPVVALVDLVVKRADEADVTEKGGRMIDQLREAKESLTRPEDEAGPATPAPEQ